MNSKHVFVMALISTVVSLFFGALFATMYFAKDLSDNCSAVGVEKIGSTQVICTVADSK
jgi:uncharacterized membrane protein